MKKVLVCTNVRASAHSPSCGKSGGKEILQELKQFKEENDLDFEIEEMVCFGHCHSGPVCRLVGGDFFYRLHSENLENLFSLLEEK